MELRHYIDGALVDDPSGWADLTEDIVRNYKLRLIYTEYPIDVTFYGSGYAHLSALYDASPCGIVPYVIKQRCGSGWENAIQCSIVLADVEFNLDKCEAKVKPTDDGIGARINNNKDIEVFPKAEQTKGNEALTPAAPIALRVFTPSTGVYIAGSSVAYDWKEALRHCVSYITDLNVTIVSDWYDALPDDERYAIIDGEELRTSDDLNSEIKYTYQELFTELGKKYNLWAAAQRDVNGDPVLRVEPEGYFYGGASTISFPDTVDLLRRVDPDRLYASVKVGSSEYIKDTVGDFTIPFLVMRGFTEEKFALKCACNTDEELDLVNKWIIDSNVIEDVVVNANDEYDEDIFLIQYDRNSGQATRGTYILTGFTPYGYNEQLQNVLVLNRWYFHCDVGSDTGDPDEGLFAAALTDGPITAYSHAGTPPGPAVVQQVRFNNDYSLGGFDLTNSYGNGTVQGVDVTTANSRYTATTSGYYYFTAFIQFHVGLLHPELGVKAGLVIQRYSAANVLLDQTPITIVDIFQSGTTEITNAGPFALDPGDYVVVFNTAEQIGDVNFGYASSEIISGAFALELSTLGGGGVINVDPDAFYGTVYPFERACTLSQWKEIRDDASLSVAVGTKGVMYRGYPKNASRNLKTGATKWELIANRA